jgi:hypothetical protein
VTSKLNLVLNMWISIYIVIFWIKPPCSPVGGYKRLRVDRCAKTSHTHSLMSCHSIEKHRASVNVFHLTRFDPRAVTSI